MYKINFRTPFIAKTKKEALETLASHGIEIECPISIAGTYIIELTSSTYFYRRKYISQTWTFEEALKIANQILDEWNNNNFDNYNVNEI